LDIELGPPEAAATGIAIAAELRKRNAAAILVFVSAHESYCRELFRYDTLEFLSKPVDAALLRDTLVRAYRRLRPPDRFFRYRKGKAACRLPLAEVLWFESALHKVRIVTLDGEREFYGKLDEVEAALPKGSFVRAHYALLVNLEHVEQLGGNNTLVMRGGRTVPLSRSRAAEVRGHMAAYFKGAGR
jgi:DNA-binding LytR/AlgR family response regulator